MLPKAVFTLVYGASHGSPVFKTSSHIPQKSLPVCGCDDADMCDGCLFNQSTFDQNIKHSNHKSQPERKTNAKTKVHTNQ